jgi:hypothetical protein
MGTECVFNMVTPRSTGEWELHGPQDFRKIISDRIQIKEDHHIPPSTSNLSQKA